MRAMLRVALSLSLVPLARPSLAVERDRSKVPESHQWNLADLYPSLEAWNKARGSLAAEMAGMAKFRGLLAGSPGSLLACLELRSRLLREMNRLDAYASMSSDQDTRVSSFQALRQEIRQLRATLGERIAFVEPELLTMEPGTIDAFLEQEKGLRIYRHWLDDVLRRKAHTGTGGEEAVIAGASLASEGPQSIQSVFIDADFPWPEVTLGDGKRVKLDRSNFTLYRQVSERSDRERVFAAFFASLGQFRRTFGQMLDAHLKTHLFYARARNYGSCLESALDGPNVPVAVYHSLLDSANANLPSFHRYLALRKRMLGVKELHYHDLYAPLVGNIDSDYAIDRAQKLVLDAMAPLGADYQGVVADAYRGRWIDYVPTEGKRAGAYSSGDAYDVHPYILLNYYGKYDDLSTLAHELGHTVHSHLSNRSQPFIDADYTTFIAEVASTLNEALLFEHLLKGETDDDRRLALLGEAVDQVRQTVFRQTQFAEFELRAHEMVERGEALTGDNLGKLYLDITRKYYGHDHGVTVVDDYVSSEWALVHHFFYNFYVFQYATSFTASAALSEMVLSGDKDATKRYLELLSAGRSDYPVELLKKAGVDMTTPRPFELTVQKMNRILDEMEKILDRKERSKK